MPDFPIIDSHVHLYDVERLSYSWMKGVPKLNRTHLVKDFDAARGAVQVDGIVFAEVAVDPGLHIEEARFVAEMAAKDPRLCATIAHAPLEKGKAVEADLATLAAIPMVKGIRRLIETEMNPAFCLEPAFIEAVKMLPRFGFSFDICVKHFAMTYAIELAGRCPDTQFILDHIGKPDIKNGLKDPWWSQIRELAHLPNVVCKISGVATEADHAHWHRDQLRPYIDHAITVFGFERVMYGSDWTVSTLALDYPTWVEIVDEAVGGASQDERHKLYRGTAARIYRLPLS